MKRIVPILLLMVLWARPAPAWWPLFYEFVPGQAEAVRRPDVVETFSRARALLADVQVGVVTEKIAIKVGSKQKGYRTVYRETVVGKEVALAVADEDLNIFLVVFDERFPDQRKSSPGISNVRPAECSVLETGEVGRSIGVNIARRVECGGREVTVLLNKLLLFSRDEHPYSDEGLRKAAKIAVYAPYSERLREPEIVWAGYFYLSGEIDTAEAELRRLGVRSAAFPKKLVVDVIPKEMLFYLALDEHMDEAEFLDCGGRYMAEKTLAQVGANQEWSFQYARSKTGALCLMQVMRGTYLEVRRNYPSAKLPGDSVSGSCGTHLDALKAAYLVLDSKLAQQTDKFQEEFLRDPKSFAPYLAAAYNGGGTRTRSLYKSFGLADLASVLAIISPDFPFYKRTYKSVMYPETWIFIKKYKDTAEAFPYLP